MNYNKKQLEVALNNWREHVLRWLQSEMSDAREELHEGEDGLAIVYRNPDQVDEDVISILWDKLESGSTYLFQLSQISDRIIEMNLAELVVLFDRTTKLKTYAWEGDRWMLPSELF